MIEFQPSTWALIADGIQHYGPAFLAGGLVGSIVTAVTFVRRYLAD